MACILNSLTQQTPLAYVAITVAKQWKRLCMYNSQLMTGLPLTSLKELFELVMSYEKDLFFLCNIIEADTDSIVL